MALGEKTGRLLDNYWTAILAGVGAIGLTVIPPIVQGQSWPVLGYVGVGFAALLTVVGTGFQAHTTAQVPGQLQATRDQAATDVTAAQDKARAEIQRVKDQARRLVSQFRAEARASEIQAFDRALLSTIEKLNTLADVASKESKTTQKGQDARLRAFESLAATALGQAQAYLERNTNRDGTVRVNFYRLKTLSGGDKFLEVVEKTATVSRLKITPGSAENDAIIDRVLRGGDEFCKDVGEHERECGWERRAGRGYICYSSVTVKSRGVAYGMLSANSDDPNGLNEASPSFLRVVGGILAMAETLLDDPEATPARLPES